MKVEQKLEFTPITITLESTGEVSHLVYFLDGVGADTADSISFLEKLLNAIEKCQR